MGFGIMLVVWFVRGAEKGGALIGGTLLNMAVFGAMISYAMQGLSFIRAAPEHAEHRAAVSQPARRAGRRRHGRDRARDDLLPAAGSGVSQRRLWRGDLVRARHCCTSRSSAGTGWCCRPRRSSPSPRVSTAIRRRKATARRRSEQSADAERPTDAGDESRSMSWNHARSARCARASLRNATCRTSRSASSTSTASCAASTSRARSSCPRSTAASASATSCSAGTARTSCTTTCKYTGWHTGYPDAPVRVLPDSCRPLPFEDDGLFFLGRVLAARRDGLPARTAAPRARARPRARLRGVRRLRVRVLRVQGNAGVGAREELSRPDADGARAGSATP